MTESFISRSWGMKTFCETSIFYDYFGLQSRVIYSFGDSAEPKTNKKVTRKEKTMRS